MIYSQFIIAHENRLTKVSIKVDILKIAKTIAENNGETI